MNPSLEIDGFGWDALGLGATEELSDACASIFSENQEKFGIRDAVGRSSLLASLVDRHLLPMARRHLHSDAFLVRSTLFDKPTDANWAVPWHQDVTIEVAERHEVEDFGPWSMKDGLISVQPPASVLEKMLTLRLHFDVTGDDNGALVVEPGSHVRGKLRIEEIQAVRPVLCACGVGDVLLMRPLLFHASNRSKSDRPRRILHLDFAYEALAEPLSWRMQN